MYTTTPPSSSSDRTATPSWFQSPARNPTTSQHQHQQRGSSSGAGRAPHGRTHYRSEDEHDIDLAERADLHHGVFSGDGNRHNNDSDHDDDDDDVEDGEREPLLSPRGAGGGNGGNSHHHSTSAAVLSPSTGSSSLLRRSFRGGIRAKRSCTDVFFLGLFAAYWVGMIVLGVYAFTRESNVSFAKYIKDGVDFQGTACGTNRFVYFPDFRKNPDFGFCVDACPDVEGLDMDVNLPLLVAGGGTDAGETADTNGSVPLQRVTFKSYATHAWTYVCAPAEGIVELCRLAVRMLTLACVTRV